jgi:AGZA family xanthine/uracil permease-like MFS transporter
MLIAPIASIDFGDPSESIPAFAVISLMSFTYNIGVGISAGLVLYPLLKVISGRAMEVKAGLWILAPRATRFFISNSIS